MSLTKPIKSEILSYELRHSDSTEIVCLLTATARRDQQQQIMTYQGIIRDVTEQRVVEKLSLEL